MSPTVGRHAWARFAELGVDELYALLRLRADVFVVEQRCAYADIDGRDPAALHLLAWHGAEDRLAGCLRVFGPGSHDPCAQIGRVATAGFARGTGLGGWLMREALAEIARRFGAVAVELDAQVEAEAFYLRFGFRRTSDDFPEDGILHCRMRCDPD